MEMASRGAECAPVVSCFQFQGGPRFCGDSAHHLKDISLSLLHIKEPQQGNQMSKRDSSTNESFLRDSCVVRRVAIFRSVSSVDHSCLALPKCAKITLPLEKACFSLVPVVDLWFGWALLSVLQVLGGPPSVPEYARESLIFHQVAWWLRLVGFQRLVLEGT